MRERDRRGARSLLEALADEGSGDFDFDPPKMPGPIGVAAEFDEPQAEEGGRR
jgi:hypothetical protein